MNQNQEIVTLVRKAEREFGWSRREWSAKTGHGKNWFTDQIRRTPHRFALDARMLEILPELAAYTAWATEHDSAFRSSVSRERTAGGYYTDGGGWQEVIIRDEVHARWGSEQPAETPWRYHW